MRGESRGHRRKISWITVFSEGAGGARRDRLQEWDPGDVFDERAHQRAIAQAILHERKTEISGSGENNRTRKPDFETMNKKPVN